MNTAATPTRHHRTLTVDFQDVTTSGCLLDHGKAFGAYTAYQMDPDTHAVTWTADRMGRGVSTYATELNESFLRVYT